MALSGNFGNAERYHLEALMVIWLTGESGSGKTTIARGIVRLFQEYGIPIVHLDGDELRGSAFKDLGYTREDRIEMARRSVGLAQEAQNKGFAVVVSLITPYAESRLLAKQSLRSVFMIRVLASEETRRARDPKGLYAKNTNFGDYEEGCCDYEINTDGKTIEESVISAIGIFN